MVFFTVVITVKVCQRISLLINGIILPVCQFEQKSMKTHFTNIPYKLFPDDDTRVRLILSDRNTNDYINANHIKVRTFTGNLYDKVV